MSATAVDEEMVEVNLAEVVIPTTPQTPSNVILTLLDSASSLRTPRESSDVQQKQQQDPSELRDNIAHLLAFCITTLADVSKLRGAAECDQEVPKRTVWDFPYLTQPSLSLIKYIERMLRHTAGGNETAVLALLYLARALERSPGLVLTYSNSFRLFAAAFLVANKYNEDLRMSNRDYAFLAGLTVEEINLLERHFLDMIGWCLELPIREWRSLAAGFRRMRSMHTSDWSRLAVYFRGAVFAVPTF